MNNMNIILLRIFLYGISMVFATFVMMWSVKQLSISQAFMNFIGQCTVYNKEVTLGVVTILTGIIFLSLGVLGCILSKKIIDSFECKKSFADKPIVVNRTQNDIILGCISITLGIIILLYSTFTEDFGSTASKHSFDLLMTNILAIVFICIGIAFLIKHKFF